MIYIFCSVECKVLEIVEIIFSVYDILVIIDECFGENDCLVIGYLKVDEFEKMVNVFFVEFEKSIWGWEWVVDV